MDENITAKEAGQVKKLIEENLKLTGEIYKMTKSIKSFILWQRIFGALKILIIVVPIVIGIIYLPPLIKDLINQYQSILGLGGGEAGSMLDLLKGEAGGSDLDNIDVNKLPFEIQKLLK
ncbi:MAG: hypothetical protein U9R14_03270 [Patescibacteria group bacterium]|nr:hypothetical protein [Patescibacteria group bacterium]